MIFVRKIDEQGYFVGDDFVEEITPLTIETSCPQGFYKPRWDFETKTWCEGLMAEEIAAIQAVNVVVDEQVLLEQDIASATTLDELKNALLGKGVNRMSKVKAEKK